MIASLLTALPLLGAGGPILFWTPPFQEGGRSGPLSWSAPPSIVEFARPISSTAATSLEQIERWLGLPPSPAGAVEWVATTAAFEESLGNKPPDWFAAVTIPTQRRILMLADRSKPVSSLTETFRHELVHWAMIGLGESSWSRLPAWFHEGVAEAWARTDPLAAYTTPLAWRAFRGELTPLSRFRDGFGAEPVQAAEGYALGHAFVERLIRIHGDDVLALLFAAVRGGSSLDQALIMVTGSSLITHEEQLRLELGSWGALLGELYPQLFLFLALFALVITPFVWRARRRRRRALEDKWEREDRDDGPGEVDDRWIEPR